MDQPSQCRVDTTIPRRQVSILAGASGSGKTTLLMQAIASWAREETFTPALTWEATRCAYLVADRSFDEVKARAKRLGIGDAKIELYGLQDDTTFDINLLKTPAKALEVVLTKFKKPFDLLVIDPIALFIEGNFIDFHQVAISLFKLGRIAVQRNITMIAAHHTVKMHSDWGFLRPQDRISGSGAFLGFSGTQMTLIQGLETGVDYDTLYVVSHTLPRKEAYLTRGSDGEFVTLDLTARRRDDLEEVRLRLDGVEVGGVISIQWFHNIAEEFSIPKPETLGWIRTLMSEGLLSKISRGKYRKEER